MCLYDGEKSTLINILLTLLEDLKFYNHHLFMDNYYNSYTTSQTLLEFGIYTTGTLRKRRGGPEIMNLNLEKKAKKDPLFHLQKKY